MTTMSGGSETRSTNLAEQPTENGTGAMTTKIKSKTCGCDSSSEYYCC